MEIVKRIEWICQVVELWSNNDEFEVSRARSVWWQTKGRLPVRRRTIARLTLRMKWHVRHCTTKPHWLTPAFRYIQICTGRDNAEQTTLEPDTFLSLFFYFLLFLFFVRLSFLNSTFPLESRSSRQRIPDNKDAHKHRKCVLEHPEYDLLSRLPLQPLVLHHPSFLS